MTSHMEEFEPMTSMAVAALVDELGRVAGMEVACIGFIDDNRHLALTYAPGYERTVAKYLATVDWASALRVVEEHCD